MGFMNGYSDSLLRKVGGHKTPKMVERYSHYSDEALHRAAESLDMDTFWSPPEKQKKGDSKKVIQIKEIS